MPAMSECLASSFASVYSQKLPINQEHHQMFSGHIEPIALSSDDINAQLTSLDTNSAMSPDGSIQTQTVT